MSTALPSSWAAEILAGIGAPVTPSNVQAFQIWQTAEGGSTNNPDAYNPLNTTRNTSSSGAGLGGTPTNSVGVLAFPSWEAGKAATIATLEQPNMTAIRAAFLAGAPVSAIGQAVTSSPWGTSGWPGAASSSSAGTPGAATTAGWSSALGPVLGLGGWLLEGATGGITGWVGDLVRGLLYLVFVAGGVGLIVLGMARTFPGVSRTVTEAVRTAGPLAAAA